MHEPDDAPDDVLDFLIAEAFRGTTREQRRRFFETGDPEELSVLKQPDEPLPELSDEELSDEEMDAINRQLGPDFIGRLLRGEWRPGSP